jgi:hypothetical protein
LHESVRVEGMKVLRRQELWVEGVEGIRALWLRDEGLKTEEIRVSGLRDEWLKTKEIEGIRVLGLRDEGLKTEGMRG